MISIYTYKECFKGNHGQELRVVDFHGKFRVGFWFQSETWFLTGGDKRTIEFDSYHAAEHFCRKENGQIY